MRIGPLRSYAPTIRRKVLLGAVSAVVLSNFFAGAALAADFTQSRYRYGATGSEVTNPALLPGWNFSRYSTGYAEGTFNEIVTNKLTVFNANPTSTANVALAGDPAATLTIVNDPASIAAAGLSSVCTSGNLYKLDNTAGTDVANAVFSTVTTGNLNAHTVSAHIMGGTGNLGMGSASGSFTSGSIGLTATSTLTRRTVSSVPDRTNRVMLIRANAGQVIYFILPQMIERAGPIPQDIVTTGATASINYGQANTLKIFQVNEPRITSKGILIEENRTNLALWSSGPGIGASWTNSGGGVTPIDGPDGGINTASRWNDNTVNGAHRPSQSVVLAGAATYTLSCYVRYGTYQYIRMTSAGTDQITAVFDMISKTMVSVGNVSGSPTNVSASIVQLGNTDWYRISLTFTPSAGSAATVLVGHAASSVYTTAANNYPGVTTNYTDFFGFQVEAGAFPTSYIPTTSAAATRGADIGYFTGLANIFGQFRTNKVSVNNNNAANLTGVAKTGDAAATLTVVDDPVAIADAGLTSLVPSGKVWKLDNSLGSTTARVGFDGQTNNTLTNTVSAYIRGSAGYIGYSSDSTAQKTAFVASASYVRRTHTSAPDAATLTSQILANPGDVVYFILPQMEDGNVATDPIVTQGSVTSVGSPFTIVAQADFPNLDGQSIYLCSVAAGTSSNDRLVLDRTNGNLARGLMISGAVAQPSNAWANKTGARILRIASRNRNSKQRNAFDNALAATTTIIPATGLDTLNIGVNQARTASFLNGYVQQLLVYGDVDDTKLAAA